MLLSRRLPFVTSRVHLIHPIAFFTKSVPRQTTPEDYSVPPFQNLHDANQDTPVTYPAGTLEQPTISESVSSTVAAFVYDKKRQRDPEVILGLNSDPRVQELKEAKKKNDLHLLRTLIVQI